MRFRCSLIVSRNHVEASASLSKTSRPWPAGDRLWTARREEPRFSREGHSGRDPRTLDACFVTVHTLADSSGGRGAGRTADLHVEKGAGNGQGLSGSGGTGGRREKPVLYLIILCGLLSIAYGVWAAREVLAGRRRLGPHAGDRRRRSRKAPPPISAASTRPSPSSASSSSSSSPGCSRHHRSPSASSSARSSPAPPASSA